MQIVIGDIHGCFTELMELLSKIGPVASDEIYTLGDLIDGGPNSPEVVEFFMQENRFALLGNHELAHIRIFRKIVPGMQAWHRQTMEQFFSADKIASITYAEAIRFFETLPLYADLPEAILVHGGVMHGIRWESQNKNILLGLNRKKNGRNPQNGLPRWCDGYPENGKPVIFGHMGMGIGKKREAMDKIWTLPQRRNLWPLDTGCVYGGYLTAVTLPDFRIYHVRSHRRR